MADITDPNNHSPDLADATGNGNGAEARGVKRPRVSTAPDDDDDDDDKPGRERRKIDIKFIQDKSRRHITFSKRKAGIMKKVCPPRLATSITISSAVNPGSKLTADETFGTGLRAIRPHRHSSSPPCRVRNRPGLHIHHPQTPAPRHKSGRQELDPSRRRNRPDLMRIYS